MDTMSSIRKRLAVLEKKVFGKSNHNFVCAKAKISDVDKNIYQKDAVRILGLMISSEQAGIWDGFDYGDNVEVRIRKIEKEVEI